MSKYITDVAIYGCALFAAGVSWEVLEALLRKHKSPHLPFGPGTSFNSNVKHSKVDSNDYEVLHR